MFSQSAGSLPHLHGPGSARHAALRVDPPGDEGQDPRAGTNTKEKEIVSAKGIVEDERKRVAAESVAGAALRGGGECSSQNRASGAARC